MASHRLVLPALLAVPCALPAHAQVADPDVIFSEVVGTPSAVVPGARGAGGVPVAANFTALEEIAMRPDGQEWVVKARTDLGTSFDTILVRGGPAVALGALAQDGQVLLGGAAGELYDFFDSPVPAAWNASGDLAFSCRARGGATGVAEKVIVVTGATHTIVAQQGDAVTGCIDLLPAISGDELLGNSINAVFLLDSGEVAYGVTPITNCHSSRYPALFRGHAAFRQSGVSTIGSETWQNFLYDTSGGTSDGLHWWAKGDTTNPNTAIDGILAVDDTIAIQEGSPVAPGGPLMADVFFTRMLSNGDWLARGDDPNDDDWAVRNGVLLAKTGDTVLPGEAWGPIFTSLNGNRFGDWVLAGETDNPNTLANAVLMLNGTTLLLREGQAIDVDGNGLFDDDAFLATIQPNDLFLTDDMQVFVLVTLRDGAGVAKGDAMLHFVAGSAPESFCYGDGVTTQPCPCSNFGATGHGCANSVVAAGALLGFTGSVATDTLVLQGSDMPSTSACIYLQGDAQGDAVFGDGIRCADGVLLRMRTKVNSGGASSFPDSVETVTLSQRGGVVVGSGAVRLYQTYYRNAAAAFCPPATFNVTNGLRVVW